MVCVPCFIIPLLLYIWHKFVQPILLRYWNPWEKKDAQGNVVKAGPEFPFECKGGVCPYQGAKKQKVENGEAGEAGEEDSGQQSAACNASKKSVDTSTTTTTTKTTPTITDQCNETKKIK